MSTALPPAPPRPPRVDAPQDLEALIKEARRRARRRRRWYAASALLAAAAAASAFAGYHHGGGSAGAGPSQERANANAATGASAGKAVGNGALTILAGSNISTIGAGGRLKALFRCSGAKGCNELESVAWSPDGDRFAFGVGSLGATNFTANGLHIVDRRSGRDRHVTDSGHWFDLAWSPDGSRLAFVDSGRIGLINADGTGWQWVQTGTAGRDSSPTWSPDGTSLAFASEIWGRSAIHIVALAGPYAKRVVPSKLVVANASSPAWSPRGGQAGVQRRLRDQADHGIRARRDTAVGGRVQAHRHSGYPVVVTRRATDRSREWRRDVRDERRRQPSQPGDSDHAAPDDSRLARAPPLCACVLAAPPLTLRPTRRRNDVGRGPWPTPYRGIG
jgi:dipeptidyl aminopeptidase/acylaminoacyl peptidase